MKKQIGVLTATRAEFGLLKPLIERFLKEDFCDVKVLVTGMHLSSAFGNTCKEIEEANIPIAARIECLSGGDKPRDITNNMAAAMTGFGEYFESHDLDLLVVLGDRYETMAVCIAAMNAGIPIAHIHGGELTEGAVDDAFRHSITKMSQLHFVTTEVYRKRVIQMGEQKECVHNVGALAVENTMNTDFVSKEELGKELSIDLGGEYAVVTFHPVTLKEDSGIGEFQELLAAMDTFPDMSFIITKSNADVGGRVINGLIDEYAGKHANVVAVTSLGARRYLSAIKESCLVLGNSSSGITEAPCLHVPTVNIGDRQKGRLMPDSVLCCEPVRNEIIEAMKTAMGSDFRGKVRTMANPFGCGDTSERITSIIRSAFEKYGKISVMKQFYDIAVPSV